MDLTSHSIGMLAATLGLAGASILVPASHAAADSIDPGGRICFDVGGSSSAPADAAVVNLTPVLVSSGGYGQLVSSDVVNPPVVANVNYADRSVDPNVGVATVGSDGQVCFVNGPGSRAHLVADQLGFIDGDFYVPATSTGAGDRKVDTRSGLGGSRLSPEQRLCFPVSGDPGDAAIVNLTPVIADGVGFGQLLSSDVTSAPVVANVNYSPGSIDPNIAISSIGADGQVCFVNGDTASVDLVADHIGTVGDSGYVPATQSGAAIRRVDTRDGTGGVRMGPDDRLCFDVTGSPGDAAIVNLTPVRSSAVGYGLLVSSDVASVPVAANVNYSVGSIDPNVAIAPIGDDGQVCYVNGPGASVDLVADQIGTLTAAAYRSADAATGAPVRQFDSRETASRRDIILSGAAVGLMGFGRAEADVISYVESALGAPTIDESETFPFVAEFGQGFTNGDEVLFGFPFGRQVCFGSLCLQFGGSSETTRSLVGFNETGGATPPIRSVSGVTVGSRWSDHLDEIVVDQGGCFTIGSGSVDGLDLTLQSSGELFVNVDEFGNFIPSTPDPADVTILSMSSGDRYVDAFADC